LAVIPTNGIAADPRARVAAVAARHESALLRIARQASLCDDDALDAYQRALEIFVRRVETVEPATEVAWLKVVIRHEAMAIRRTRSESVADQELDFDAFTSGLERDVDDQIASSERVRRSAEALRALKPDEAKALMMKAHGLSYEEIGERNGWSYTKVNRAISEGRRRFMAAFSGIESGEECERFAPIVEALALGSATSAQLVAIRPHLRHCTACRAAMRDLHLTRLHRASLLWPILGAVWQDRPRRHATDAPHEQFAARGEADSISSTFDGMNGSTQTVGNQLIAREAGQANDHLSRLRSLRADFYSLLHRANASDVATSIHVATGSGGGRIAALAATIGVCVTSATVGTACVVSSLLSTPANPSRSTSVRLHGDHTRKKSRVNDNTAIASAPSAPAQPGSYQRASRSAGTRVASAATPAINTGSKRTTRRKNAETRAAAEKEFGFETTSAATPPPTSPSNSASSTATLTARSTSSPSITHSKTAVGKADPAQEEFGP
jgi:RNA polymerase sigma factor (sigma-70 family)